MPARIAVDVDLARAHPVTDKVHARQVSLEVDAAVGGIAGDGEHFGQRQLPVAVEDLDPFDLGQRLVAQPVRDDSLNLDGNGCLRLVSQSQRHQSDSQLRGLRRLWL